MNTDETWRWRYGAFFVGLVLARHPAQLLGHLLEPGAVALRGLGLDEHIPTHDLALGVRLPAHEQVILPDEARVEHLVHQVEDHLRRPARRR